MNNTLQIAALLDKPDFLENLVEKLAERRNETGYGNAKVPRGLKALEISSTEAYVSGDISLTYTDADGNEQRINMPFITSMFFTCKKTSSKSKRKSNKNNSYKVTWSTSMS